MKRVLLVLLAMGFILSACKPNPLPTDATTVVVSTPENNVNLPTPQSTVSSKGCEVDLAARNYIDSWKNEHYDDMYAQLSTSTQSSISRADFEKRHRDSYDAMTLRSMSIEQTSSIVNPDASAQIALKVRYATNLFGTLERDALMNLVFENNAWKINWDDGMLMNELKGGNYLYVDYIVPARGSIYDSEGKPLASQADAVSIGVIPGQINPANEESMLELLSKITGLETEYIKAKYESSPKDWFVPIADVSSETSKSYSGQMNAYPAITPRPFKARFYPDGGIAPHVTGFVQPIFAEELEKYKRLGYRGDEMIGKSGLEQWGEQYLAGSHGATLYVKDPNGKTITKLASLESKPAYSITTTINSQLQYYLQNSLGDLKGVIIVMEKDTGRILAMVSNPGINPNIFEPTNPAYGDSTQVYNNPDMPMLNRATQGVYPNGSTFKVITMAAALETGVFQRDTKYDCKAIWNDLGVEMHDWTYTHGVAPSGVLNLQEAIMRSCNPWFWHVGKTLWDDGYKTALYDVAKGFGLGQNTGIEIPEFAGRLDQPQTVSDNVQLSIGQSTLQVSPLQVLRYYAAIGNDGTLYKPTLVEKIAPVDGGTPVYTFTPTPNGKLPISDIENLYDIQRGLIRVVADAQGTAIDVTRPMNIAIAGKTGTAETSTESPHAWFAGYTWEDDPKHPDIAVVVMLENAGEGSVMAAPLFKRAVELYFSDFKNNGGLMPWEDKPYHQYVEPTETPEP